VKETIEKRVKKHQEVVNKEKRSHLQGGRLGLASLEKGEVPHSKEVQVFPKRGWPFINH